MMSKRLSFIVAIIISLLVATATLSEASVVVVEEEQQKSGSVEIEEDKSSVLIDNAADAASIDTNQQQESDDEETLLNAKSSSSPPPPPAQYEPPSHFHISAHIQTNLHTGLSYFLPLDTLHEKSFAHLPFLECGAIGSTTATVPLVSGVFRHVPLISGVNEKEKMQRGGLEFLEETIIGGGVISSSSLGGEHVGIEGGDKLESNFFADTNDDGEDTSDSDDKPKKKNWPKRPSPPTYVVALSPLEITVGGNGNETQQFDAGDVIFFEDTWLGIWDEMDSENDSLFEEDNEKLFGYIMRASPDARKDMNVFMLTIPPALHRQWKHRHNQLQQQQKQQKLEAEMSSISNHLVNDKSTMGKSQPWWKLSSRIIKKQIDVLPEPCSLESDPAFAHPSVSVPPTLSHHFSQHFTKLLRQFQQPFHLSLSSSTTTSHSDYDLILPILAQTTAAMVGAATAFAGVLHLLRTVNPTVAIMFGGACVIGFGTWGIVWFGEELLDEWEMWRERRRLERRMSESWGAMSA
ncbi:hypothetical protein ACHAXM_001454 [Skeletonema potamos]